MLMKEILAAGAGAIVVVSALQAQDAAPTSSEPTTQVTFEVASVRPNNSNEARGRFRLQPGGRVEIVNMPISHLISFAYPMTGFYRHVGGPQWINQDRFDIVAKLEGDPRQLVLAMRSLLAERFKLKVHKEARTLDVYTLELIKPGAPPNATLKPTTLDCSENTQVSATPTAPPCRVQLTMGRIRASGSTMETFANEGLAPQVGRVVIDKTGITGRYDFELAFAPEPPVIRLPGLNDPSAPPPDPNGPSIFTALKESMGMKLVAGNAPVDVVVIDSVEHPVPN
jgi:uncharacterized protein (TIGR03435 family)